MKEQKDPKMDWGFHAVIPRIVRTEYKQVAPLQKWAYVCLKDLCGETGTCYRTIRVLSEEIGLSVGMTSETIRVLHDAGLIHAEKKKRHTGGKEVWHITIVDIWAKNGATHPTKRSPHEQECSPHERTTGQSDVHSANVHRMNKNNEFCSPHEQECSHSETEEESISRIITEAGSEDTDAHASRAGDEDIPYTPNFDFPPRETIEELSPVLEKEIQHVETLKEQASHIATLPQTDPVHGVGYEKPSRAATRSRANSEPKQSKRTSKSSSEAKKSEPLTMPPEDAPWNTTTCLHLFDFWRGAPLLRKDECIKASHCAKGLAENYTRKQVETVRRWMRERDPYWSQRASSVDVCQVAGQIHRILADIEAARQVKRAASTQAVDPQVAAVRALAQRFSAPVGER